MARQNAYILRLVATGLSKNDVHSYHVTSDPPQLIFEGSNRLCVDISNPHRPHFVSDDTFSQNVFCYDAAIDSHTILPHDADVPNMRAFVQEGVIIAVVPRAKNAERTRNELPLEDWSALRAGWREKVTEGAEKIVERVMGRQSND